MFGDYELLHEVARGGMGIVYRARQVGLDRVVALKMILGGRLADDTQIRRFQAEAMAAGQLSHPNIVAIYDVGRVEDQHFFSMEFIEGQSLAEMVRERPLPPLEAARYVRIAAEAIDYAHGRDILHRDLKPSNVIVDTNDQPRITDFGLAKRLDEDSDLTASGFAVGTPSYMPPEQAAGLHDQMDRTSDVYSLGAILYELVTGRPPFKAANVLDTLLQVRENEVVPPRLLNPNVPRDLDTIIRKCLAKDQKHRYATAAALADDLGRFQEGEPILAQRIGPLGRLARWTRRHPMGAATMGIIMLTLLFATLAATSVARRMSAKRLEAVEASSRYAVRNIVNTVLRRLERNAPRLADIAADEDLAALLSDVGDGRDLQTYVEQLHRDLVGSAGEQQALALSGHVEEPLRLANLFVLNVEGTALARSPNSDQWATYVGKSWAMRDYYLGAKQLPPGKVYVSKAYKSNTDGKVKFALSAPVYFQADAQPKLVGVLITTVETDRNLGLSEINDDLHHVVLLGLCDESSFTKDEQEAGQLRILVHPSYDRPGLKAHAVNDPRLIALASSTSGQADVLSLRNYRDPVGAENDDYAGQMLASCASIDGTPFMVLVQEHFDHAVGADRVLAWELALWGAGALVLAILLLAVALRYAFWRPRTAGMTRISGMTSA
jgi:serine/threonine-protein kinase